MTLTPQSGVFVDDLIDDQNKLMAMLVFPPSVEITPLTTSMCFSTAIMTENVAKLFMLSLGSQRGFGPLAMTDTIFFHSMGFKCSFGLPWPINNSSIFHTM